MGKDESREKNHYEDTRSVTKGESGDGYSVAVDVVRGLYWSACSSNEANYEPDPCHATRGVFARHEPHFCAVRLDSRHIEEADLVVKIEVTNWGFHGWRTAS